MIKNRRRGFIEDIGKRAVCFTAAFLVLVSSFMCLARPVELRADREDDWPVGPSISGDAGIVVDAETGNILYEKDIYGKYYPASTTKVLTTLVAIENGNLDDVLTVSYAADNYVSKTSSRMGLTEGEQVTVEQALYGIMLESGNEATYAVGEHVGHSIAGFIKLMNRKAQSLGCEHSHFANSHGLHDEDHYTCAYDMSLIARAAYKNEAFMKITGTAFYNMPATNKHEAKILTNHHWFLNGTQPYEYCIGGKTGATNQAGYALVTYARKDGKTLISVVMHAPTWEDVYADSRKLLEYCFNNYSTYRMADLGEKITSDFPSCFGNIELFERDSEPIISISGSGTLLIPDGFDVTKAEKHIVYDNAFEIEHGENVIGTVSYVYGSRVLGSTDIIYYNNDYPVTESVFNKRWPKYMIPVDVAFEGVTDDMLHQINKKEAAQKQTEVDKRNSIALGIGIGIMVFVIGGLIIVIRRMRRERW